MLKFMGFMPPQRNFFEIYRAFLYVHKKIVVFIKKNLTNSRKL